MQTEPWPIYPLCCLYEVSFPFWLLFQKNLPCFLMVPRSSTFQAEHEIHQRISPQLSHYQMKLNPGKNHPMGNIFFHVLVASSLQNVSMYRIQDSLLVDTWPQYILAKGVESIQKLDACGKAVSKFQQHLFRWEHGHSPSGKLNTLFPPEVLHKNGYKKPDRGKRCSQMFARHTPCSAMLSLKQLETTGVKQD